MASIEETIDSIVSAPDLNARVAALKTVPTLHGTGDHEAIFSAVSRAVFVNDLQPSFASLPWVADHELETFAAAYAATESATNGFTEIGDDALAATIRSSPTSVKVFRTIVGYTPPELTEAVRLHASEKGRTPVSENRIKAMEAGNDAKREEPETLATVFNLLINQALFPAPIEPLRLKQNKPDTVDGWATLAKLAKDGVPLATFLHQRHYGGAFLTLLNSVSSKRGNALEDPIEELFTSEGVPHLRTGSHNQADVEKRFGVKVKPAPDFVIFDQLNRPRGLLECKLTGDGGTARDKAARFKNLHEEGVRLGGVPVFAVIDGLGWRRANDAIGPVVQATEGRLFTLGTLDQLMLVDPLPALKGLASSA